VFAGSAARLACRVQTGSASGCWQHGCRFVAALGNRGLEISTAVKLNTRQKVGNGFLQLFTGNLIFLILTVK